MAVVMTVSLAACGGASSGNSTSKGGASSSDKGSGDVFKVGAFLPLSGASAAYGIEARNAIELAIAHVNENGGFNGKDVKLVAYDTQCSVEEAVKVVSKLIDEEKVDAMIGSIISSEIFAAGNAVNNAGVYMLGLGTSATWMEEDWPYVYRAAMNNGAAAPTMADMLGELKYESVAAFYGQDDAALSTYQAFKSACEDEGIDILVSESYDQGDTDYSAQVTNIINSGADCVYISVIGETAPIIVKQLRQYGYTGIIFDKESFMASQVSIAGEGNSDYIVFVNPYVTYESIEDIDIEQVKDFAERYKEAYGDINKTDSAYRGWDAIMVMWEASKIAGANDSESLKDATNKISGMEGLGGNIDFTSGNREGYNDYNAFLLKDGKNVLWSNWVKDGGYDDFLAKTDREK